MMEPRKNAVSGPTAQETSAGRDKEEYGGRKNIFVSRSLPLKPVKDSWALALNSKWNELQDVFESNPSEMLSSRNEKGMTLLHWICSHSNNGAACNVLDCLILSSSSSSSATLPLDDHRNLAYYLTEACCVRDENHGMTPLLYVCCVYMLKRIRPTHQNGNLEAQEPQEQERRGNNTKTLHTFESLATLCPSSLLIPDDDGWTVLHYICFLLSRQYRAQKQPHYMKRLAGPALLGLVQHLTAIQPNLKTQCDHEGKAPIYLLCEGLETEFQAIRCYGSQYRPHGIHSFVADLLRLTSLLVPQKGRCPLGTFEQQPYHPNESLVGGSVQNDVAFAQRSPFLLHDVLQCPFALPDEFLLLLGDSLCAPSQHEQQAQQQEHRHQETVGVNRLLRQDENGNAPLHLAMLLLLRHKKPPRSCRPVIPFCSPHAALALVQLLLRKEPRAAQLHNHRNATPLSLFIHVLPATASQSNTSTTNPFAGNGQLMDTILVDLLRANLAALESCSRCVPDSVLFPALLHRIGSLIMGSSNNNNKRVEKVQQTVHCRKTSLSAQALIYQVVRYWVGLHSAAWSAERYS